MSESRLKERTEARAAVAALFARTPPLLVEVRFPGMATSSDWHLLEDEEELDALLERLGPGAELHLSSVWDLRNVKEAVHLVK